MKRLLVIALLILPACGGMAANRAAEVASQQHNCPRDQVTVVGEGGQWQYWLNVCGRRRLYDTQGGRYIDITGSLE